MTGNELRQQCVNIMNGWVGGAYQGAYHREIIQIWNAGKDTGQYMMNMTAPYCAATVSAAWIKAGIGKYVPKDTYCPTMITKAKSLGMWVENDAYTPKPADVVLYNWSDGSNYACYDNATEPDHVGMVVRVSGNSFVVAEGNMSGGKIGTRNMVVNGRYIRGFIVPDYDAIAKAIGGSGTVKKELKVYNPWKAYKNGSTRETVYADTDFAQQIGSLDSYESCYCMGRYGGAYAVLYQVDGFADRWKIGYVAYHGGVTE